MKGAPSRRQHKKFCDAEGWTEVSNARGGTVRHRLTYELTLATGEILRTRISRPANNDRYGPSLWSAILRGQLCVTETEFWQCINKAIKPPRPGLAAELPGHALPAGLVYQLIHTVGLNEHQVASMTLEEAVALITAYWSRPPD